MSAWRKFQVFMPQFIAACMATAGATAWAWFSENAWKVAVVPVALGTLSSGLFALFTTVFKATEIDGPADWERLVGKCKRCAALEQDRDELRRAITELKP